MKILKLLSKKYLLFLLLFFMATEAQADDKPVDIWNINEETTQDEKSSITTLSENKSENNDTLESSVIKCNQKKELQK